MIQKISQLHFLNSLNAFQIQLQCHQKALGSIDTDKDLIGIEGTHPYQQPEIYFSAEGSNINSAQAATKLQNKPKKKRVRKYVSKNPNNKKGHWNQQQILKYHYFLELNAKYFFDKERRKVDKIFKAMSKFIETRQPYQCRSHQQKIQKKWKTFGRILLNLRQENFNSTSKQTIVSHLKVYGYETEEIFSHQELENEEQIVCKIRGQKQKLQQLGTQTNEYSDQLMASCDLSQQKAQCLIWSEQYENYLGL